MKRTIGNERIIQEQQAHKCLLGVSIHMEERGLEEKAFYPAHEPRKETSAYTKAHHQLCVKLDLPCLICGVKNSTLHDPKENKVGAKAMETHHHVVEWALSNAVDPAKFNARIRPALLRRHPYEPMYQRDMSKKDIIAWIDHSPHNLWVLCDVHHRHRFYGIHEITFPVWCAQDLLDEKFLDACMKQITGPAKAKPKTRKKQ